MRISSQARTDSQAWALIFQREPKGGPQCGGARVLAEDGDNVVNVRGVPTQKLVRTLKWAEELGRALDFALCSCTLSFTLAAFQAVRGFFFCAVPLVLCSCPPL